MKRLLTVVAVVALACSASAHAYVLTCLCDDGAQWDGDYSYEVQVGAGETMDMFFVATNDSTLGNYSNVSMPAGWSVSINTSVSAQRPIASTFTPHGNTTSSTGTSVGVVLFQTASAEGPGTYTFSFTNNTYGKGDADAGIQDAGTTWTMSDWGAPVGSGSGPVHGPINVPEPGSVALVALGCAALVFHRRRSK